MQDLIIFTSVTAMAISIMYVSAWIKERISKFFNYKAPMATWEGNND